MTMAPTSDELTAPIAADRPCGDNLEDTPLLSSFDAFRLFGQPAPYETAPDWSLIQAKAVDGLARSKDLRLLAHFAAAVLRTDGLAAFVSTLNTAAEWLHLYWQDVFPLLEEDAILRRSALNCFADPVAIVDPLRRLPLARSRQHGTFSLRDIDMATGMLPLDPGTRIDEAQVDASFAAMAEEERAALHDVIASALTALYRIDGRMRDHAPDAAPTFEPLLSNLSRMQRIVATHMVDGFGRDIRSVTAGAAGAAGASTLAPIGTVFSREDAVRALDAVSTFFQENEPSNPIPLLLARAKRLVSKPFLEVLADIAPDALAQARLAAGVKASD